MDGGVLAGEGGLGREKSLGAVALHGTAEGAETTQCQHGQTADQAQG